ncbi:MAG: ABC transporter ATP-binding protein [Fimbriimonadales bacterium]|nr:ABC transporter ATP-binding protein [Fimbriimonadales bacterium]
MSSEPAIVARDLVKDFVVSHSGANSLKTTILWFRKARVEKLRVLDGVSFDIGKGTCVAVIGKNGAGKSTLLALLARVYRPTSGFIRANGRIAPLLELGAGFHPDLTGLENVLFNGVILGLSRREISKRIDQIVEFSEIGHSIDAPVRTYSSGMLARLGFAVAGHMDAEILVVDEVLSVGDLDFERKCVRRIQEFRENGGTIFFVSHHLETVRRVADRCLWLKDGRIAADGTPDEVTALYEDRGGR